MTYKLPHFESTVAPTTIYEAIAARYDGDIFRLADTLGVGYRSVISSWEARIGTTSSDPIAARFKVPPLSLDTASDIAYQEIVNACQDAYFDRLSREDAVIVTNALAKCVRFSLGANDLCFCDSEFCEAWNAAHPEAEPIQLTRDSVI